MIELHYSQRQFAILSIENCCDRKWTIYRKSLPRYKYSGSLRGEYDFTLNVKWVMLFTRRSNYDKPFIFMWFNSSRKEIEHAFLNGVGITKQNLRIICLRFENIEKFVYLFIYFFFLSFFRCTSPLHFIRTHR